MELLQAFLQDHVLVCLQLYLMSTEEDSPKFGLSASRKFGSKIVYDFLPRDGSEEADWRRL